jgi:hypothetical protein
MIGRLHDEVINEAKVVIFDHLIGHHDSGLIDSEKRHVLLGIDSRFCFSERTDRHPPLFCNFDFAESAPPILR